MNTPGRAGLGPRGRPPPPPPGTRSTPSTLPLPPSALPLAPPAQGILVIRFEMPFNVWCGGCGKHIAKGERFNAEKKQEGAYHSTKIYAFRFNTACCQSKVEIRTDPEHCDYRIVTGAMRRKEGGYDARAAEVEELARDEHRARIRADPMFRAEADGARREAVARGNARLDELREEVELRHGDEFEVNRELRRRMRGARAGEARREARQKALGLAPGIRLLPTTAEDREGARLVGGAGLGTKGAAESSLEARRAISRGSIFGAAAGRGGGRAAAKGGPLSARALQLLRGAAGAGVRGAGKAGAGKAGAVKRAKRGTA